MQLRATGDRDRGLSDGSDGSDGSDAEESARIDEMLSAELDEAFSD